MTAEEFHIKYLITPPRSLVILKATAAEVREIAELGRPHAAKTYLAEALPEGLCFFRWSFQDAEDVARRFSSRLAVDVIHLWFEKVSDWTGFHFYRGGGLIEAFEFGFQDEEDYGEESDEEEPDDVSDDSETDESEEGELREIRCEDWPLAGRDNWNEYHYRGPAQKLGSLRPGLEFILRRLPELGFRLPEEYPSNEQAIALTPP